MRLVDYERVVVAEIGCPVQFGQQHAVGHQLDQRPVAHAVGKTDLVADGAAEGHFQLLGQPLGQGPGRDTPGLRVADETGYASARLQAHLRQLGALPRAGLAGDHDHLVGDQGGEDLVFAGRDGEVLGVRQRAGQRVAGHQARRTARLSLARQTGPHQTSMPDQEALILLAPPGRRPLRSRDATGASARPWSGWSWAGNRAAAGSPRAPSRAATRAGRRTSLPARAQA